MLRSEIRHDMHLVIDLKTQSGAKKGKAIVWLKKKKLHNNQNSSFVCSMVISEALLLLI